ncbi:MAG: DUF2142 domain-containing protein [Actinomycetaceae bacterium]|nr:DUF2142 domain-containing protein [Actinomycetaceae bacterium]
MSLSNRRVVAVWAVVFALGIVWSFLIPLRGQSDESAHAAHAAAVARGQTLLEGEFVTEQETKVESRRIEVWVPANYSDANVGAACMFWKPDVAESCASAIPDSHGKEASVFTPAANYPPVYYAAVGWPSLFFDGAPAWYGMRILTALLCSLAVTMGVVCLERTFGMRTALATLVALTPTSLSFFGTINPQGLEIALAYAMACLMAPLACGHRPSRGHLASLGAVAGLLTVVRPSSALWTVLIGLLFAICIRAPMWRHLFSRAAFYVCLGIVALAGVAAVVWNRVARPGENALGWPEPDMSFSEMMERLSSAAGDYWEQAFGNFGWESNPVPDGFGWAFLAVCAVLAVAALIVGNAGQRAAVVLGIAIVPLSTIFMQFVMLPQTGIIWQGRYNLPIIAAVIVLCSVVVARSWGAWASVPLLFAFVYFTLIWALRTSHRYATGLNVAYGASDAPFDHIVALTLAVACAVGLGVFYWQGRSRVYARAYIDVGPGREPARQVGADLGGAGLERDAGRGRAGLGRGKVARGGNAGGGGNAPSGGNAGGGAGRSGGAHGARASIDSIGVTGRGDLPGSNDAEGARQAGGVQAPGRHAAPGRDEGAAQPERSRRQASPEQHEADGQQADLGQPGGARSRAQRNWSRLSARRRRQ